MAHFFEYKRREVVNKLDENGARIPLMGEDGLPNGKFQTEEKVFTDFFNMDFIIRTFTLEDGKVAVLLDDGHEDSVPTMELKNKLKPPTPNNIIEGRRKQWIQSEILIEGDDIFKLYEELARA